ncbi:MAG TPA: hypothetical protein VFP46_02330 [Candidatus Paceibacterota bacterium]|nr:hypothetical protein [Candidatus Paceibacterota bacterium]
MSFKTFVGKVIGTVNSIVIPVIFALSLLVFVWGVTKYFFLHGGNEEERLAGRQFIFWGILGMVLMFSVWGVVNMLLSTLRLS